MVTKDKMIRVAYEVMLEEEADKFLMRHFTLTLKIPIIVSGKMSRSLGFLRVVNGIPKEIKISRKLVENNEWDVVLQTLHHECIHYALCRLGEPFGDNDQKFIDTCKRLGVKLSGEGEQNMPVHVYYCEGCDKEYHTLRKIKFPICVKCDKMVEYRGKEVRNVGKA